MTYVKIDKLKILIATRNKDKVNELKQILMKNGIESISLDEWDPEGTIPGIEETGRTLKENAFLKARTVFTITGIPTVADDTGLEVDALNGAPGVFSSRYAGEGCSYEDNVVMLLEKMAGIPHDKRTARFRTVTYFIDTKTELSSEGVVEGYITNEPRGSEGFGYDSIFYLPDLGKTYGELTGEEKNRVSHRNRAMTNLIQYINTEVFSDFKLSKEPSIFYKIHDKGTDIE